MIFMHIFFLIFVRYFLLCIIVNSSLFCRWESVVQRMTSVQITIVLDLFPFFFIDISASTIIFKLTFIFYWLQAHLRFIIYDRECLSSQISYTIFSSFLFFFSSLFFKIIFILFKLLYVMIWNESIYVKTFSFAYKYDKISICCLVFPLVLGADFKLFNLSLVKF